MLKDSDSDSSPFVRTRTRMQGTRTWTRTRTLRTRTWTWWTRLHHWLQIISAVFLHILPLGRSAHLHLSALYRWPGAADMWFIPTRLQNRTAEGRYKMWKCENAKTMKHIKPNPNPNPNLTLTQILTLTILTGVFCMLSVVTFRMFALSHCIITAHCRTSTSTPHFTRVFHRVHRQMHEKTRQVWSKRRHNYFSVLQHYVTSISKKRRRI